MLCLIAHFGPWDDGQGLLIFLGGQSGRRDEGFSHTLDEVDEVLISFVELVDVSGN